jgi:hypothetical protein
MLPAFGDQGGFFEKREKCPPTSRDPPQNFCLEKNQKKEEKKVTGKKYLSPGCVSKKFQKNCFNLKKTVVKYLSVLVP